MKRRYYLEGFGKEKIGTYRSSVWGKRTGQPLIYNRRDFNTVVTTPIYPLTHLSGGKMKIQFNRVEEGKTKPNANGKTFSVIRVFGKGLEGKMEGQEWSTQFFKSNKELAEQIKDLKKGDYVNVTMKQNGQFWNAVGFAKTEAPIAQVAQQGGIIPTAVNPRMDNLKLATKILGEKGPEKEPFEYLSEATGLADLIGDYINKSGAFQFNETESDTIPEIDDELA
jgi:hypothetical protein